MAVATNRFQAAIAAGWNASGLEQSGKHHDVGDHHPNCTFRRIVTSAPGRHRHRIEEQLEKARLHTI